MTTAASASRWPRRRRCGDGTAAAAAVHETAATAAAARRRRPARPRRRRRRRQRRRRHRDGERERKERLLAGELRETSVERRQAVGERCHRRNGGALARAQRVRVRAQRRLDPREPEGHVEQQRAERHDGGGARGGAVGGARPWAVGELVGGREEHLRAHEQPCAGCSRAQIPTARFSTGGKPATVPSGESEVRSQEHVVALRTLPATLYANRRSRYPPQSIPHRTHPPCPQNHPSSSPPRRVSAGSAGASERGTTRRPRNIAAAPSRPAPSRLRPPRARAPAAAPPLPPPPRVRPPLPRPFAPAHRSAPAAPQTHTQRKETCRACRAG